MCRVEVQPEALDDLGRKLKAAAEVAGQVQLLGSSHARVDPAVVGEGRVGSALADFLRSWSYGCGYLRDDAGTLAALLARAGRVYLDVESAIAGEPR